MKELLDLIDEAGNRFEKELASAWRNPGAKPPRGSFEDSLAKDLLVSHIFGRPITWSDWIEIREFLKIYDNVRMVDLRNAWFYRDQTQAPHVYFRMTWPVRLSAFGYRFLVFVTTPLCVFGTKLLLNSFGIHSDQLRLLEAVIILSLLVFILNVIFNYGGYAAFLICKKTESPLSRRMIPVNEGFLTPVGVPTTNHNSFSRYCAATAYLHAAVRPEFTRIFSQKRPNCVTQIGTAARATSSKARRLATA